MLTENFCLRQNFFNAGHVYCSSSGQNQDVILSRLVQNTEFAIPGGTSDYLFNSYVEDYMSRERVDLTV
ncbi:hypothetical protein BN439_3583 [Erwinia amylovora Ea644]|nr:hypothetical protein BN439_3583 [Erwinia amylovora Ea644]CCP08669.1 hypothetical protein BN440_3680 [Erwinia amylovora MR1]